MRKFFLIIVGLLRYRDQLRRVSRRRGRGRGRQRNLWAYGAGKLLRYFLSGRR